MPQTLAEIKTTHNVLHKTKHGYIVADVTGHKKFAEYQNKNVVGVGVYSLRALSELERAFYCPNPNAVVAYLRFEEGNLKDCVEVISPDDIDKRSADPLFSEDGGDSFVCVAITQATLDKLNS